MSFKFVQLTLGVEVQKETVEKRGEL